jgi:hypothetical protein
MVDYANYDLLILLNIVQGVLGRIACNSPIGRKHQRRRIRTEAIEKAIRREICHAIVVNSASKRDGTWSYRT